MEDDIDIEEHDVLDNPRLRNIFPDLAMIKTEVIDDEYTDSMDCDPVFRPETSVRDPDEEYTRHRNKIILGSKPAGLQVSEVVVNGESVLVFGRRPVEIKQEVEDHEHIEESHEEDPGDLNENIRHLQEDIKTRENPITFHDHIGHPSVLILGSKPAATKSIDPLNLLNRHVRADSTDSNSEESVDMDIKESSVVLENWGPILEKSDCFCNDCEILFPTNNTLLAHNTIAHSFLVAVEKNKAVKSTAKAANNKSEETGKFCNHCNKMFPDSNSLISHLYETLTSKKNNGVFKNDGKPQDNLVIPQMPACLPVKKLILSKTPVKIPQLPIENQKLFYRCKICFIYFKLGKQCYTRHILKNHLRIDANPSRYPFEGSCKFCDSIFSDTKSYNKHIARAHLDEYTRKGKIRTQSKSQTITSKTAASSSKILTEKSDLDKKVPVKREAIEDLSNEITPKRAKETFPIGVYYCHNCGCCLLNARHKLTHKEGNCKKEKNRVRICNICGLLVSSDTHSNFHEKHPGVTLMDMKFFTVAEHRRINPPIPQYPQCKKCKVHFCRRKTLALHNCDDLQKTCKYCKKKFSDMAYKLHVKFHEYANFAATQPFVPKKAKMDSPELPELIKQYKILPKTWNILYLCSECDIICDSYDLAVEHCQAHFNNLNNHGIISKHCNLCDLKFDIVCYEKHKKLHSTNKTLNKKSFHILMYNYRDLCKSSWYKCFEKLSENQMEQIESQSIYAHTRSVKFRVVQNGASGTTMYRCDTCKRIVSPKSVWNHHDSNSCYDSLHYNCRVCSLRFCSRATKDKHEGQCKFNKDFRIVNFNEKGDEEFNKNLRKQVAVEPRAQIEKRDRTQSLVHYYVCKNCKSCLRSLDKVHMHKCRSDAILGHCKKCNLSFYCTIYRQHKELHEAYPQMSRKHINLTPFTPKSHMNETVKVKLYKCVCGLHFTSYQASDKHIKVCAPNTEITKENCSKCNRLFDTTQLVSHLCKHHSNNKNTLFEIVNVGSKDTASDTDDSADDNPPKKVSVYQKKQIKQAPKYVPPKHNPVKTYRTYRISKVNLRSINLKTFTKNLYKCIKCGLCLLKQRYVEHHGEYCGRQNITRCDICKYTFTVHSLEKHKYVHHHKMNLKREGLSVKVFKDNNLMDNTDDSENKSTNKNEASVKMKTRASKNTSGIALEAIENENSVEDLTFENDVELNESQAIKEAPKVYKIENILFKCYCGLHLLAQNTLNSHKRHGHKNIDSQTVKCKDCGLKFTSTIINKHQHIHHEKQKLSSEDFYIVPYTKYDKTTTLTSHLFKCQKCHVHFWSLQRLIHHIVIKKHKGTKTKCTLCGMLCGGTISVHVWYHHKILKRSPEDFVVLESKDGKTMMVANTSHNKEEYHLQIFQEEASVSDETHNSSVERNDSCRKSKEPSAADAIPNSLVKRKNEQKATGVAMEIDETIETPALTLTFPGSSKSPSVGKTEINRQNKIYKCDKCPTHFMKFHTLLEHAKKSCSIVKKHMLCTICSVKFSCFSYPIHISLHHHQMKLKREDIQIVTMNREVYSQLQEQTFKNKLYKCYKCNIHFIVFRTLQLHIVKCDGTIDSTAPTCKECNLRFSEQTLQKHMIVHHQMGLTAEDLYIYEMDESFEITKTYKGNLTNCTEVEDEPDELTDKISTLNPDLYTNKLYKCKICSIHFLTLESLEWHTANSKHDVQKSNCTFCGFAFTVKSLPAHVFIHHDKLNLSSEHFCVSTNGEDLDSSVEPTNIEEINDNVTNNSDLNVNATSDITKSQENKKLNLSLNKNKNVCGPLRFKIAMNKNYNDKCEESDKANHSFENTDSDIETANSRDSENDNKESSSDNPNSSFKITETAIETVNLRDDTTQDVASSISRDNAIINTESVNTATTHSLENKNREDIREDLIKLYKCSECNVCFLTQATCYKHTINHTPLEPKDYIECKLCGYQFIIINSLHKHIAKHHNEQFKPENVLIEEYHPNILCHGTPKIDIYYGTDRVQSKLISTTCEGSS